MRSPDGWNWVDPEGGVERLAEMLQGYDENEHEAALEAMRIVKRQSTAEMPGQQVPDRSDITRRYHVHAGWYVEFRVLRSHHQLRLIWLEPAA